MIEIRENDSPTDKGPYRIFMDDVLVDKIQIQAHDGAVAGKFFQLEAPDFETSEYLTACALAEYPENVFRIQLVPPKRWAGIIAHYELCGPQVRFHFSCGRRWKKAYSFSRYVDEMRRLLYNAHKYSEIKYETYTHLDEAITLTLPISDQKAPLRLELEKHFALLKELHLETERQIARHKQKGIKFKSALRLSTSRFGKNRLVLWWTLRQMKSRDMEKRLVAKEILLNSRNDNAVKPLLRALDDGDGLDSDRNVEIEGVLRFFNSDRAVEEFTAALKDSSKCRRRAALSVLALIESPRSAQPIFELLKAKDGEVRRDAAGALKVMSYWRAVGPLMEALASSDKDLRTGGFFLLRQTRDDRAIELLIAALKDPDRGVRACAGVVFWDERWKADARPVEPLMEALADSDLEVREIAATALGLIKDKRAVEPLLAAVIDNAGLPARQNLWRAAVQALLEIGAIGVLSTEIKNREEYALLLAPFEKSIESMTRPDNLTSELIQQDLDEYQRGKGLRRNELIKTLEVERTVEARERIIREALLTENAEDERRALEALNRIKPLSDWDMFYVLGRFCSFYERDESAFRELQSRLIKKMAQEVIDGMGLYWRVSSVERECDVFTSPWIHFSDYRKIPFTWRCVLTRESIKLDIERELKRR